MDEFDTQDPDESIQIVFDSIQILDEAKSVLQPSKGFWGRSAPLRKAVDRLQAEQMDVPVEIPVEEAYVDDDVQEVEIVIKHSNNSKRKPEETTHDVFEVVGNNLANFAVSVNQANPERTVMSISDSDIRIGPMPNPLENWKCVRTKIADCCLLIMKAGARIALLGAFKYQVLHGHVDFFGYREDNPKKLKWHKAFISPLGPAAYFACMPSNKVKKSSQVDKFYNKFLPTICETMPLRNVDQSFVLISKYDVESALLKIILPVLSDLDFLSTRNQLEKHRQGDDLIPSVEFVNFSPTDFRVVFCADKLLEIAEKQPGQIITCVGDKNCGKSTFVRYLANRFISYNKRKFDVYFLETDVGQSEFLIEGCVTLAKIDQPILHLPLFCQSSAKIEHCSLYGYNAPSHDVQHYMDCISHCMTIYNSKYKTDSSILIVNTHGYVKDEGSSLMQSIFEVVTPSCVLQITSLAFAGFDWIDPCKYVFCQHLKSPAYLARATELSPFRSLTPYKIRTGQLIAHFSRCLNEANFFALNGTKTYKINFSCIAVGSLKIVPPSRILALLNASLVAVGSIHKSKLVHHYFDDKTLPYSIPPELLAQINVVSICLVRGIDMQHKCIYILGPIDEVEISSVNVLLHHPTCLPVQFYETQKLEKDKHSPYLMWKKTKRMELGSNVPNYDKAKGMINAPQIKRMHYERAACESITDTPNYPSKERRGFKPAKRRFKPTKNTPKQAKGYLAALIKSPIKKKQTKAEKRKCIVRNRKRKGAANKTTQ